jgi:spore germination protein YaaH
MQGNLITTLLALVFYVASGVFGVNPSQNAADNSNTYTNPSGSGYYKSSKFPLSGKVSGKQAALRQEPDTGGKVVTNIASNSALLILDEKNGFYYVQSGNQQGWIPTWLVSIRQSTPTNNHRKVIAGYYVENYKNDPVGYQVFSNNLNVINTLIPFSFKVDQYGNISGSHSSKTVALAHSSGATTLALVNNIQGSNFNSNMVHRLLSNSVARSKAINGILRVLLEKGYQGVNIDFENVPSKDRTYVTTFFRELAAALHAKNLLVTASLPAKTSDDFTSIHGGAFDYQKLALYLDQIMIMTYDEHYSGGSAGPVASYPWVERVIKYTLRYFPANKVIMGLAGYGYDWGWTGKALHYNSIQNLIKSRKITPRWDFNARVPYFTYSSWGIKHQVWYEDRYSTASKMQLVTKYGLRGVAVWRLGYEDPGIWNVIQKQL